MARGFGTKRDRPRSHSTSSEDEEPRSSTTTSATSFTRPRAPAPARSYPPLPAFEDMPNRWSDPSDDEEEPLPQMDDDNISTTSSLASSDNQSTASSSRSKPPNGTSKGRGGRRGGVHRNRRPPLPSLAAEKRSTANQGCTNRFSYALIGSATEKSHTQSIYGVAFNHWVGKSADIFATCGDTKLTVYECRRDLPGGFTVVACFTAEQESFYSCDWSMSKKCPGTSYLIAAGQMGHVRVLDMKSGHNYIIGSHPSPINDVRVHRCKPELLATASDDYTVRLWHIPNRVLIGIFGGAEGPRDQIVTVAFHDTLPLIASSGLDHTIHLWSYGTEEVEEAMKMAEKWSLEPKVVSFPTAIIHRPHYATKDLHNTYVDSMSWWGDLIISRSAEQSIAIWKCGKDETEDDLMELKYDFDSFNPKANSCQKEGNDENPEVKDGEMKEEVKVEESCKGETKEDAKGKAKTRRGKAKKEESADEKVASGTRQASSSKAKEEETTVSNGKKNGVKKAPGKTTTTTDDSDDSEGSDSEADEQKALKERKRDSNVRIYRRLKLTDSNCWYLRFALNYEQTMLAFGDMTGALRLYYLGQATDKKRKEPRWSLLNVKAKKIPAMDKLRGRYIRQTAFNYTGQLLVSVSDGCHVNLYRIKEFAQPAYEYPPSRWAVLRRQRKEEREERLRNGLAERMKEETHMEVAHSSPTKKTASSRWSSRDHRAAGPSEEYKDDYVNDLEPYELNEELDELHLEEGQQQSGAIEVIDLSDDDSDDDDDEVIALDE